MLNLVLNWGVQRKVVDQPHREYCFRPGVVDFGHLEFFALKRVSKSSWIPQFRLIALPTLPRCLPPSLPSTHENTSNLRNEDRK